MSECAVALGAAFEAAYRAEAERRGWNVCSFTRGDKTARTWCNEPHWDVAAEALTAMLEQVGDGPAGPLYRRRESPLFARTERSE